MQDELRKLFISKKIFDENQSSIESFLSTMFGLISSICEFQPEDWIETVVPQFIKDRFIPSEDIQTRSRGMHNILAGVTRMQKNSTTDLKEEKYKMITEQNKDLNSKIELMKIHFNRLMEHVNV